MQRKQILLSFKFTRGSTGAVDLQSLETDPLAISIICPSPSYLRPCSYFSPAHECFFRDSCCGAQLQGMHRIEACPSIATPLFCVSIGPHEAAMWHASHWKSTWIGMPLHITFAPVSTAEPTQLWVSELGSFPSHASS